jgi:cytochrome P450
MVIAGYDTTSATSMWALKHLSNNPGAQEHLRNELQRALPDAKGRYPTVQEIVSLRVPYLDATVQEVFRISLSASAHARTATEDTIVLGHFIPKGTNVFMLINGPSFMSPPFPIREELRSKTSQMAKAETPEWDYATLSEFRPERWLVEDEHGQAAVDLAAAPQMLFSLGPRACFGKKMAVLSMKINLVCMVWAFDLLPVPDQLNSFEGAEVLARTPTQGYIRLSERPL